MAHREEAQAGADAITIQAEARKVDLLAEAEGWQTIAEAENSISEVIMDMKVALERLEALPEVVKEMVKPAEKIDSIKTHQVQGLSRAGGSGHGSGGNKPVVNQALDSIMGMAVQMPALKELGVSMEHSVAGLTGGLWA